MNNTAKMSIFGGIATIVILAIVYFFMGVGAHNSANKYEKTIIAAYENNKNVLSNVTAKLLQTAQVNKKYAADVKELATAALSARYGESGSKATMQWIKEKNGGNLDAKIYTRLMDVIEAGRNEFQVNQSILLDKKRAYTTELDSYFTGMLMAGKGFPKIKLDEYKIVISQGVIDTFETGVEKEVQLF
jgi:hypothetical protein